VAKLRSIPLAVVKSPWSWPILPVVAIAAVGEWGGMAAVEAVAAVCGAAVIGLAIGLAVAGTRGGAQHAPGSRPSTGTQGTQSPGVSSSGAAVEGNVPHPGSPRIADLRGARLTNSILVGADLRQADLRGANLVRADLSGANLVEADLSGANLTEARLGPLQGNPQGEAQA